MSFDLAKLQISEYFRLKGILLTTKQTQTLWAFRSDNNTNRLSCLHKSPFFSTNKINKAPLFDGMTNLNSHHGTHARTSCDQSIALPRQRFMQITKTQRPLSCSEWMHKRPTCKSNVGRSSDLSECAVCQACLCALAITHIYNSSGGVRRFLSLHSAHSDVRGIFSKCVTKDVCLEIWSTTRKPNLFLITNF